MALLRPARRRHGIGAADAVRAHSAPPEGSRPKDTGGTTPATLQVSPVVRQMAIFGREFVATGRRRGLHAAPTGPAERPGERTGPAPATASADPIRPRPDPVAAPSLAGRIMRASSSDARSTLCLSASELTVHVPHRAPGHGMKCLYTILANGRAARWASEHRAPAIASPLASGPGATIRGQHPEGGVKTGWEARGCDASD